MALNADNVLGAPTGAWYINLAGTATDPTGTGSVLTSWEDCGFISDAGVELTLPDAPTPTAIKAWQNGAVVKTLRTAPEDPPTLSTTFIETKLSTIGYVFGTEIEQTAAEGTFVINTNKPRAHVPLILDVVDGSNLFRLWAPKALLTSVSTINFANTAIVGYPVTVALEYDTALDGQARVWMTALRTLTP